MSPVSQRLGVEQIFPALLFAYQPIANDSGDCVRVRGATVWKVAVWVAGRYLGYFPDWYEMQRFLVYPQLHTD